MNITEVEIFPVNSGRLKAYASVVLDHSFVIHDLKVIDGNKGLFVAMPSRKQKDGKYKDVVHPINQETRDKIEKIIFEAYERDLQSKDFAHHNKKQRKAK